MRKVRFVMRAAIMEFLAVWAVIWMLSVDPAQWQPKPLRAARNASQLALPQTVDPPQPAEQVTRALKPELDDQERTEFVSDKLESSAARISTALERHVDRVIDGMF